MNEQTQTESFRSSGYSGPRARGPNKDIGLEIQKALKRAGVWDIVDEWTFNTHSEFDHDLVGWSGTDWDAVEADIDYIIQARRYSVSVRNFSLRGGKHGEFKDLQGAVRALKKWMSKMVESREDSGLFEAQAGFTGHPRLGLSDDPEDYEDESGLVTRIENLLRPSPLDGDLVVGVRNHQVRVWRVEGAERSLVAYSDTHGGTRYFNEVDPATSTVAPDFTESRAIRNGGAADLLQHYAPGLIERCGDIWVEEDDEEERRDRS